MTTFIIQVVTTGQTALYFNGRTDHDWLTENPAEACEYSPAAVTRRVTELKQTHASAGITFVAIEKPRDSFYELLNNCGDQVGTRSVKGGTGYPAHLRRQIADELADKHGWRRGEGFIQVRDMATWEVIEKLELAP